MTEHASHGIGVSLTGSPARNASPMCPEQTVTYVSERSIENIRQLFGAISFRFASNQILDTQRKKLPGSDCAAPIPPNVQQLRRYHGSVSVDPARVGRDAGRIADEVIAHLLGQTGAEVTVTIEIDARRMVQAINSSTP